MDNGIEKIHNVGQCCSRLWRSLSENLVLRNMELRRRVPCVICQGTVMKTMTQVPCKPRKSYKARERKPLAMNNLPHGQPIYKTVKRTAERAGLGKVTPHDLRRTLQSLLGREGVDRNVRASIAGHADADTTDTHYRLVYEGEAGEALTKMASILGLAPDVAEGHDDAN